MRRLFLISVSVLSDRPETNLLLRTDTKNLLSDDLLYLTEKVRYDADPNKFEIDANLLK